MFKLYSSLWMMSAFTAQFSEATSPDLVVTWAGWHSPVRPGRVRCGDTWCPRDASRSAPSPGWWSETAPLLSGGQGEKPYSNRLNERADRLTEETRQWKEICSTTGGRWRINMTRFHTNKIQVWGLLPGAELGRVRDRRWRKSNRKTEKFKWTSKQFLGHHTISKYYFIHKPGT